ncbi:MAG: spermidine synthase [Vicinamibacterales bacterium]
MIAAERRILLGLFLLACATLAVEVVLTRIFDVLLWPNFSFSIISGAMFGLALGGLFELLAPARVIDAVPISRAALLFGVSVWAIPLVMNALPFSLDAFGTEPVRQLGWFLLLYLALLVPFFLAGICICRLFSRAGAEIRRFYFWDLSGAAVGTALIVPLLPRLGPERLLLGAALMALGASALFADARRWRAVVALVAAVVTAAAVGLAGHYATLKLHDDKRGVAAAIRAGRLEFSRWDPVSQISVIDQPAPRPGEPWRKYIAYDGGSLSSHFYAFDGDYAALRRNLSDRLMDHFWQRGVLASHYLLRDRGERVLVIGSAGGQEVTAARMYGASHIDAVDLVGTVVALAKGRYANYIGRIYNDPRVNLQVGEGRTFLRASKKRYDVIQIFSNYTAWSLASGSGALTPDYLLTEEAFVEYFSHLGSGGILHINHHTYPRIITTAAAAWRSMDREDFRAHVVVFEREDAFDRLPTILIKMSPWTGAEIADLSRFFATPARGDTAYRLAEDPLDPVRGLPDAFYSGDLPAALEQRAPYNIAPITDDEPAFNFLRRSARAVSPDPSVGLTVSIAAHLNGQLRGGWLPMDWLPLIVTGCASLFYGVLFIVVPMSLSSVGRQRWRGKSTSLVYFAMLGFAFIAVELLFIQLFMKLIGYPLYSVATVITVMLIGAALGSMSSLSVAGGTSSRWPVAFAGVILSGIAIWAWHEPIAESLMGAPQAARIAAAAVMIFPISFFMGMPFPLGMLELRSKPPGAIAWAWSMNGLCTTIGSLASTSLSVWIGFRGTLVVALGVYTLAAVTFGALRRANASERPVRDADLVNDLASGPALIAVPRL